jgi:hypothetical protein
VERQINVTRTAIVERTWRCERCGASGLVNLKAVGHSGWRREGWSDPDQVAAQAREDASYAVMHDAERILAMIVCPTCREPARGAVFWSRVRMIGTALIGVAGAGFLGFLAVAVSPVPLWLAPIGTPLGAWIGCHEERRRRRESRGVIVVHLVKGEAKLPVAIARVAPPRALPPAPKLEPLRTSAPESIAPADASEGPRFLKED